MTRYRQILCAVLLAGATLTGCESVQRDMQASMGSTRAIFTDFSMEKLLAAGPAGSVAEQSVALATPSDLSIPDVEMIEPGASRTMSNIAPVPSHKPPAPKATAPAPEKIVLNSCPDVRIVQDLDRIHQFAEGRKLIPAQAVSSIRMNDVTNSCKKNSNGVSVDMTLAFNGDLGPRGKANANDKPSFSYPYFVAVTNRQGNIVSKEVFAVTMTYDGDSAEETKIEKIRQTIPANESVANYKVLIGFQLNEEELAYNRSTPSEARLPLVEPAAGSP